jgi:acyl homoserine lactone synthase
MIESLNIETCHLHGDALPSLLRVRYREFVERLKYDVPNYNRMEYDQYDTPAAVYFVWRDENNIIRAGSRISPTNRPYMLKDLWPQAVTQISLPSTPKIWEVTRLFVDKTLSQEQRQKAHGEMLCAYFEFAEQNNITNYIGVAPPGLWKYTFLRCGWPVEFVGDILDIGYIEKIVAGMVSTAPDIQENVRKTMKIPYQVLADKFLPLERAA